MKRSIATSFSVKELFQKTPKIYRKEPVMHSFLVATILLKKKSIIDAPLKRFLRTCESLQSKTE